MRKHINTARRLFFPLLPHHVILILGLTSPAVLHAADFLLQNEQVAVRCDPSQLSLTITPAGHQPFVFKWSNINATTVSGFNQSSNQAEWRLVEPQLSIALLLETNAIQVDFTAAQTGKLEWPQFTPGDSAQGWILPMFEGVYVALTNSPWRDELLQPDHDLNTTADLTLPFWGLDASGCTLTCLLLNPFNNEFHFDNDNGRMRLNFSHEFTRNNPVKHCAFRFIISPASSPVEPAREYRRWLQSRGEFVSMAEKIKRTPDAEKLLGAAHAYLWGDAALGADDVKDWQGLAQILQSGGAQTNPSPASHIASLLNSDARKAIPEILAAQWPDRYNKGLLAGGIDIALAQTNFYNAAAWQGIELDSQTKNLLERGPGSLSQAELCRLNTALLAAALGKFFKPPESWGGGESPQLVKDISAAGFDRMWLGAEGWSGFVRRPETVSTAREHGYLIGTYDSFHSIHSPDAKPDQTWPTAQFDAELFRTGAIIKADGKPRAGFKKRGFVLSPIAARPWVERRVAGLMKIFPANSWFVDCDGFGEFFDDYSPVHPATQASDMAERASRCAWIRDTYHAVIGSEGCSAGMAGTLHFAHGVLTPVIGWGDADLSSRSSKYWLGGYYPPDEPSVFFKPVPLKEKYRQLYYDPASRLPLFQAVFHDSVVATHHWSNPSLKFPEVADTVELLELLYNVPPLYHLNRPEFAKRKTELKRHYDFFSPLHRELALLPLSDFRWLSANRLVQTATFGDTAEITANFGKVAFTNATLELPAKTIEVRWKDPSRKTLRFQAAKALP